MPWRDHVDRQLILFIGSAALGLAALVALQQITTPRRTTRGLRRSHRNPTAPDAPRHSGSPNTLAITRSHTASRSRPSSAVVRSQSRRREPASPPPHPPPNPTAKTAPTAAAIAVAEPTTTAAAATEPLTVQSLHRHRQRVHGEAPGLMTDGATPTVPPLSRLTDEAHAALTREYTRAAASQPSPRDEPHTTRVHLDTAIVRDETGVRSCEAALSKCPCPKACQTDVRWFTRAQGTQTTVKELPQPPFTPERLPYMSGLTTTTAAYATAAAAASPLDELPSPIAPPSSVNASQPLFGEMIGLTSPPHQQGDEVVDCGHTRWDSDAVVYHSPANHTTPLVPAATSLPRYLVHEVKLQVTLLIDDICTRPMQSDAWYGLRRYLEQLPMATVAEVMQLSSVTDFAHALPMLQPDTNCRAEEQLLYSLQMQVRNLLNNAAAAVAPDMSATSRLLPQHTSCDESSTTMRRRRRFANITIASDSDEERQPAVERTIAVHAVRPLRSADMSTLIDGEAAVARVARLVRVHHYLQMRNADTQTQSGRDGADISDGNTARIAADVVACAAKSLHDASCQTEHSLASEKNGVTATLVEEGDEAMVSKDASSAKDAAALLLLQDLVHLRRSDAFASFRRLPGCATFACDFLDLALRAEELMPRLSNNAQGGIGATHTMSLCVDAMECDGDSLQADERAALAVQRALISGGASFEVSTPERTDAREHVWPSLTRDDAVHTPPPLRGRGHKTHVRHAAPARPGGVRRGTAPSSTTAIGVAATAGATSAIFARPRTVIPRAMAT